MSIQWICNYGLLAVIMAASGCASQRDSAPISDSAAAYTIADFRRLAWLQGRWMGVQPDGTRFYEGYEPRNDSTWISYTYADSTMAVAATAVSWRCAAVRS